MAEDPVIESPCPACGEITLKIQWREELIARALGTWSLPGSQPKTSASMRPWPYLVCDECAFEERAKVG